MEIFVKVAMVIGSIIYVINTLNKRQKNGEKNKEGNTENSEDLQTEHIDKNKEDKLYKDNQIAGSIDIDVNTSGINMTEGTIYKRKKTKEEHMKYIKARKLEEDYVVFDFETTGLSPHECEIIQIGAVKFKGHERIDQFETYVKPEGEISKRITRITGITDDTVKDAPTIEEVLPSLVEFAGNNVLIAHNASFDMKFLLHNLHEIGEDYKKFRVIDTLRLARKYIDTDNHKLVTLKSHFGLDEHGSHDALEDCLVTAEVYKHCYEQELGEKV